MRSVGNYRLRIYDFEKLQIKPVILAFNKQIQDKVVKHMHETICNGNLGNIKNTKCKQRSKKCWETTQIMIYTRKTFTGTLTRLKHLSMDDDIEKLCVNGHQSEQPISRTQHQKNKIKLKLEFKKVRKCKLINQKKKRVESLLEGNEQQSRNVAANNDEESSDSFNYVIEIKQASTQEINNSINQMDLLKWIEENVEISRKLQNKVKEPI
ncbi:hypothetical protein BpHYR1_052820 [Brachionus plicatilis]|uniref:Uncharacterized protein n=1 Tax=Brachionus plicatilis TaxID=10195 RepID=A0A3M7SDP0_BRAPC|nr:hypothetical protein BpHYR1_052820 [Brachionus plicatilis]